VTSAAITRSLARARAGKSLNVDEAVALLQARGSSLDDLLSVAADVRDRGLLEAGRSGVITYSRKVFIPLTRLCRDRCHYCTFVAAPGQLPAAYLSPHEVLQIARTGAAQRCKEALFTLGDQPELRWPQARGWLDAHGYDTTLDYVRAMAVLVLEETGLLPHLNPGVLTWQDFQRLKPVAPSMGMMLETTSTRLWSEPGQPHFRSPDKEPAVRLQVLEDAGRNAVPFTTGVLVGIGETLTDRIESILAIRASHQRYEHIQEVIVQNFRSKPDTAMRNAADVTPDDYLATIAVARLLLGPGQRLQAPPNLSDPDALPRLIAAGIDDWGGVSPLTPDHVNPERPWPHLADLARVTAECGFQLRERLTTYPRYVMAGEPWLDPRVSPHVQALADASGLADESVTPRGMPWQEPDPSWTSQGRSDLHATIDLTGRSADRRSDFDRAYGDWEQVRRHAARLQPQRLDGDVREALRIARDDPAKLLDPSYETQALALLHADGPDLDAVCALADDVRRDTVGEVVTFVVNRNINFTNVCYTGCRFCAFAQRRNDPDAYELSVDDVVRRALQAWDVGATEVCLQGGIDPTFPATGYVDLVSALKSALPDLHVHAFSPMEIVNGASRSGTSIEEFLIGLREAGLDTIPGTAAEILDDDVRWVLTKGKLPASSWIEVITTAHRIGLRSSATMMFGHVDQPRHWLAHLRVLAQIQDDTGGFTEFVPLSFVHQSAPLYLAGAARPGPTQRENRVVHAAARLLLHGRVDHIQTSWVKLGDAGCQVMLAGGADDLGGTLMEETISRMAGSPHGSARSVSELVSLAASLGRPARLRTTTYGQVNPERTALAGAEDGRLAENMEQISTVSSAGSDRRTEPAMLPLYPL
jgi:FO synthase